MKKLSYETPEMEVVYFEAEDVIRTSNGTGGTGTGTQSDFGWDVGPSR